MSTVVVFLTMLGVAVVVALGGYQTGKAEGYCAGKYGVQPVYTGTLGTVSECEIKPEVPAARVRVP